MSWRTGESSVPVKQSLVGSWLRAGHQKDQAITRSFGPIPCSPGKGEGLESKLIDGSCRRDGASMKIPSVWARDSWAAEPTEGLAGGSLQETVGAVSLPTYLARCTSPICMSNYLLSRILLQ